MENKNIKDYYIGEVYAEDVYAYAHMSTQERYAQARYWEFETGIVAAMRVHKIGWVSFYWPAALTETLWYVYRGMIKEAIFFDAVSMVLCGVILHFSWIAGLIIWILFAILKGFLAVPLYYIRIRDAVEKRGLLMRTPEEVPEIEESLSKEGKPSVLRTVLYLFLKCFAAICLDSVLFSVFSIFGI